MEKSNQIRFQQFKLLVNQFNYIDYDVLSQALKVNIKTIRDDFKKYMLEYKDELTKIDGRYVNDHFSEKSNYFYKRKKENGFCRLLNQYKTRAVSLTNQDIVDLTNFASIYNDNSLKNKLLKLLTNHSYRLSEYNATVSVIEECIEKQKCFKPKSGYYLLDGKENSLDNKQLFPINFDVENDLLYALIGFEYKNYDLSLIVINIHTLIGCMILGGLDDYFYPEIHDMPYDIIDAKHIDEYDREEETFIDIFGNIQHNSKPYIVVLNLNSIARANFLKRSIRFHSYIKENKKGSNFPYKLKLFLNDIDEISGLILSNIEHIEILDDLKFKEAFKKKINNLVSNL